MLCVRCHRFYWAASELHRVRLRPYWSVVVTYCSVSVWLVADKRGGLILPMKIPQRLGDLDARPEDPRISP